MAPPRAHRRIRALQVTIVSDNAETLDGLQTYLRRAGITTNGTRQIQKSTEMTPPSASAVVVFPDDFHSGEVMSALAKLHLERAQALVVLVTREPARFQSLPSADGGLAPLVIPKPAWGWTILDAIRARMDTEPPEAPESGENLR